MIGRTLAHYRIESKLGQGGMGVVYKARDIHLGRPAAIKVLPPEAVANPKRKTRFAQEARAASALNHPNIITIYGIERVNGVDFIAMEYVDGKTLDELTERGALALPEALKYAVQIADGLANAHGAGIVHRDLKPQNVMVRQDGLVKILDFGLAKLTEPVEGDEFASTRTALPGTEEGTILGTVAYMSPEQAQGKELDARSDIFSFGSLLYEMVTGRRAFEADGKIATMAAILHHEPRPVGEILEGAPADLEKILTRCLRKDADRRFQHMADVKIAVQELKEEIESGRIMAPVPSRPHGAPVLAAAILVVAFAAVGWWLLRSPRPAPAPVLTRLTSDSGLTTDPAFSPDGKLLAYASDRSGQDNLDIWRLQIATGESIRLTSDPADESEPTFSPDGSRIAFRSERESGGIYVISAFGGGEPRLIAKGGRRPRFSPDGNSIAYYVAVGGYLGNIFVAPSAGGGAPTRLQPDFFAALYPIWAPDGQSLLFLGVRSPQDESRDLFDWWVSPKEGGAAVETGAFGILRKDKIIDRWPSLVAPAEWIGEDVFFSGQSGDSTNVFRLSIPPKTRKAAGATERLTSGTSLEAKPSVLPGGRIAFASLTSNLNIWSLQIDANRGKVIGEPQKLTHAAYDAHTSLSADGRKLVFISSRSGNPDVWLKDLVTGKETALTATPASEEQPDISPDGARVSYLVIEGPSKLAIYVVGASGGLPEKVCEACGRPWDWSPDGKYILFVPAPFPRPRMELGLLEVSTRRRIDFFQHPQYNLARARFSPDGRWISLGARGVASVNRVAVLPFRGEAPPAEDSLIFITDYATDKSRWSPDGNLLYYTSNRDGFRCVYARRLEPATKRPIGEPLDVYHSHSARRSLLNAGILSMEISLGPDKLVFNLGELSGNIWMARLEAQK